MARGDRLMPFARRAVPAVCAVALLAAVLLLANDAASGTDRLSAWYPWVLTASVLALVALAVAIARRLLKLRRELRALVPGARLTRRLLVMLIFLALPPVFVVYGFALNFLDATVDTWFNVHMEAAMGDALEIGRVYLSERLSAAQEACGGLAKQLSDVADNDVQTHLDAFIDSHQALQVTVFDANQSVIATTSSDPQLLTPAFPDSSTLLQVRSSGRYAAAEPIGSRLTLRIVLPLHANASAGQRLLQALYPVPPAIQPLTTGIEQASFDLQRLKYLRGSLKLTFNIVLTFVLLLSALFAVVAAFGTARRVTAPIGRLATATQAVGAGRYDTPLPIRSDDELGFLLASFDQMQRELELASSRVRASAEETENQRAYLKALLERLSAGVLGLDRTGVLRTANHAAEQILDAPLSRFLGQHLSVVRQQYPALAPLIDPILKHVREGVLEWREEVVIERAERIALTLRGAELGQMPGSETGVVVVIDDLTLLNRAQRDAAWAEVARRLAHEVKNPLTPIQLAAERLRRRFIGRLAPEEAEVMDRATHTIISQVEALKSMVNSFGDYARPPQIETRPTSLHALLGEVLDLYENDQRIQLTRRFTAADPVVRVDAGRVRQLLHNLIKNAIEAIGDTRKPHIDVSTCDIVENGQKWIELIVADNGPGLPEGFDERWYEPYTTSKAKGTGLGLAVAKKIAEEHGGGIHAANRSGGGAQFTLRLPREG
jgi:nitrogen fixation/metabolism regulation signal transduction histidine kinase